MKKTDTATLWACLCAGDILLRREGDTLSLPIGDEPPVPLKPWNIVTTLSTLPTKEKNSRDISLRVVRIDKPVIGFEGLEMMNLRASFDVLPPEHYALAGKAAELIYWDANTKFCGCCGAPMKLHTEISKRCTECGKEVWPQLATAVIVRVTRGKECPSLTGRAGIEPIKGSESVLLVHANNFRRPYYGLVAGFVETGETLEEAVRREVREETGIEIKNIRYYASQPWPYPCGLMVGFTADYVSGDIHLQRSELASGGWFTRDNMPPIPGKSSIARALIDDWLNKPYS
ncbi:MAG: NAD(+) diphosphatase [Bacteroidaceae bacterium]|nr:NAD(+) diphosphatase [Bacteroidaceae bacterium]